MSPISGEGFRLFVTGCKVDIILPNL